MQVTIIGLGLIGGSMALDLKSNGFATRIIGVDANLSNAQKALELGIADEIRDLEAALDSRVIIIAVPVTTTSALLPKILDTIAEDTVVIDTGSTKQQICKIAKKHKKGKQFVGTHPIAGTEYSGPEAAQKGLFKDKLGILCVEDSALWAVELASEVYEALGSRLIFMDPAEHDKHLAYVSHISHISSFALASTVLDIEKDARTIFDLAGSGFASTVRLAKSSPEMWAPIFDHNAKHVSKALGTYIKHLEKFKKNIDKKRRKGLETQMKRANEIKKIIK